MSRPRVLVIGLNYRPERTGIAPYTAGMAGGLAGDFSVQVLTTHPHYPDWRFDGPSPWRTDGVEEQVALTRLKHYLPKNPTGAGRIISEASFAARAAIARTERADVILCVTPGLLPVATAHLLGKRWGVPVGVVVQDLYSRAFAELGLFGGRLNNTVHRLESALLSSATGVVAVHQKMAETISSQYRVDDSTLTSIPNWAHVRRPSGEVLSTREELGWKNDEVVVLHAGNMGAKQALEHVIDAATHTDPQEQRVRFVLMGGGSRRESLERAAERAGVEPQQLTIMDGVDEHRFMDILAAADVLLLHERPGLQEMCAPSKLTSYFAAGRPVLAATEQNSAAAIEMRASGAGAIIRPGSSAGYADAAIALLAENQRDIAERSQRYAAEALSESLAVSRYKNWVNELLSRGRTP